jgi:hypothetical protein
MLRNPEILMSSVNISLIEFIGLQRTRAADTMTFKRSVLMRCTKDCIPGSDFQQLISLAQ